MTSAPGGGPEPQLTSLTPTSGNTYGPQNFAFVFTDPQGANNVQQIQMMLGGPAAGCYAYIWVDSAWLYLADNSGGAWAGSGALGSSSSPLSNSQCRINLVNSSQVKQGNNVTVTLNVEFFPAYGSATPRAWAWWADDKNGNSLGWNTSSSTWTVPVGDTTPPNISNVSHSGITSSGATIAWTTNEASTTQVHYGTTTAYGSIALNNSLVTNHISIISGLLPNTTYLYAVRSSDSAGNITPLPAQPSGTFTTLPSSSTNQQPVTSSIAPAVLAGRVQTITFRFGDPNGYTDLAVVKARITTSLALGDANGCSLEYLRASDILRLYNDTGSGFVGQIQLSPGNTIENSYCKIVTGNEAGVGGSLSVTVTVTAKPVFTGEKKIFELARDASGMESPWTEQGTWRTCQNLAASAPGTPGFECTEAISQGNGEFTLSTTVRLPGGSGQNISELRLQLHNAGPWFGFGCILIADPSSGVLYLEDDIGDWGPNPRDRYVNGRSLVPKAADDPAAIDWPNNSQCTLKEAGSSITAEGERVTANFRVALKPTIKGQLKLTGFAGCSSCGYSPLADLGTLVLAAADQTPQVLPLGFSNASGAAFRVEGTSGRRQIFYLRYAHPNGIHQLQYVWLNVSSSSTSQAGGSTSCQVRLNLWTGQLQLAASGSNQFSTLGFGPVENTQCRVYASSSQMQFLSATEALVRLDVESLSAPSSLPWYLHRAVSDTSAVPAVWSNPDSASYVVAPPASQSTTVVSSSTLANFQACLNTPGTTHVTCVLADGIYYISEGTKLEIKRSNIVARGASKDGTMLVRLKSSGSPYPYRGAMLGVFGGPAALTNIVISHLTFDGSRGFEPLEGQVDAADVTIVGVDGTSVNTDEAAGVVIRDCRFRLAPLGSIAMHPGSNVTLPTRKIVIRNNEFKDSLRAAIHIGLGGQWSATLPPPGNEPGSGVCDSAAGDNLPARAVQDVVIRNNFFENNDTGATGFDATKNVTIENNAMLDNYNQGLDCGGGVIAVQSCGKSINILNNFLWNRNVFVYPSFCPAIAPSPNSDPDRFARAAGLEIWGTNFQINGNWIEYFADEGIGLMGVQDITVSGNRVRNNSRGIRQVVSLSANSSDRDRPGIRVAACEAPAGTPQAVANRQSKNVSIQGTNSVGNFGSIYQSYGVLLMSNICSESSANLQNITVLLDANASQNKNRDGRACEVEPGLATAGSSILPPCAEPTLGQPANCTSAGCQ